MSAVVDGSIKPQQAAWRRRVLLAALAASIGVTIWTASSSDDGDTAPPVTKRKAAAREHAGTRPAATAIGWPASRSADTREPWPAASPLARSTWGLEAVLPPPQAKAAAEPEPLPPQAPALTFSVVGRMDDGRPRAVFSNALRTEVLGVGEVLDQQWRIDAIGPQGVQLSWLRDNQKKTLTYGSPPP